MPFRGPGPYEVPVPPPGLKGWGPVPNPQRFAEDLDIERDQLEHRVAETIADSEQYDSPIMTNERKQRRLARQARKAAPKPGEFNLVPPGRNPFGPPAPPVPPPPGPAQ